MKNKWPIVTLHLLIMIPAYLSPFWLDWRLIILGIIIYYIQLWIFGGCILTFAQYGRWNETFSGRSIVWLSNKLGFHVKLESTKKFLDVLPFIYIIIAIIYQVLLHGPILLRIK